MKSSNVGFSFNPPSMTMVKFSMRIKYFNKNVNIRKYLFLKIFLSDLKMLSIRNKIETICLPTVHGEDSTPMFFLNSLSSMAAVLPSFSCELWTVDGVTLLIHRMGTQRLMQYILALLGGAWLADVHNSWDVSCTRYAKRFRMALTGRDNALALERPREPSFIEGMILSVLVFKNLCITYR